MKMAEQGRAGCRIVVPETATPRETFAASQLRHYLNLISGAEIPVVTDATAGRGPEIILGGPERNRRAAACLDKAAFDRAVPGPEGMMIQTFGDRLLLAGSSSNPNEKERGTLYAVYEFLERFLDCSFAAYSHPETDAGEHVPRRTEVSVGDLSYVKPRSDVMYRTAIAQYSNRKGDPRHELNLAFLDWLAKNRYNRILTWAKVYEAFKRTGLLEEATRRGFQFTVGHHEAAELFLPPAGNDYFSEPYYRTHPEYYKMMEDGTRFEIKDHWGQLVFCARNEDGIRQIAQNMITWIGRNPEVDIIAFWMHDGRFPACCCDACRPYSKIENYAHMVNVLAERVSTVHPQVNIDMLIYTDIWSCPDGLKLHPCVVADEATWSAEGLRYVGKPDGSALNGTPYEENLLGWKKAGAQVVYYDYYMGVYPARQRFMPAADEIQRLARRFVEKGILGSGTQIEVFNHWNHLFNFYCFARTMYDTDLAMEDNLARFARIFGKGAEPVLSFIRYAESVLDGQARIMFAGLAFMEQVDKEKCHAYFEEALRRAETARHRNNVRLMRMAFRYSELECREDSSQDEKGYRALKIYTTDDTGELRFMRDRFDSFQSTGGLGIAIPVDCEQKPFPAGTWYAFE